MGAAAFLLTTSLLAMGPQWALIDLPYPEVTGAETAEPPLDARIARAVADYAKTRAPQGAAPGIAPLQVQGDSARLRVTFADRSEIVILVRIKNEWRVVQSLAEGKEY